MYFYLEKLKPGILDRETRSFFSVYVYNLLLVENKNELKQINLKNFMSNNNYQSSVIKKEKTISISTSWIRNVDSGEDSGEKSRVQIKRGKEFSSTYADRIKEFNFEAKKCYEIALIFTVLFSLGHIIFYAFFPKLRGAEVFISIVGSCFFNIQLLINLQYTFLQQVIVKKSVLLSRLLIFQLIFLSHFIFLKYSLDTTIISYLLIYLIFFIFSFIYMSLFFICTTNFVSILDFARLQSRVVANVQIYELFFAIYCIFTAVLYVLVIPVIG